MCFVTEGIKCSLSGKKIASLKMTHESVVEDGLEVEDV